MRGLIALIAGLAYPLCQAASQPLAGTQLLTEEGDFAVRMVEGIDRYLTRATAESVHARESLWKRDFSSHAAYESSVAPNRARFRRLIGVVDERVAFESPSLDATIGRPAIVAIGDGYEVRRVRWPVLPGVEGEGLLLEPSGAVRGRVVALPDADWTPEMLIGLDQGVSPAARFPISLVENGFQVLIPLLIDRSDTWSGHPAVRFTNSPHREWIYRSAYEMGRHIAGYEVQKVLAAVDWFSKLQPRLPVGVIGYGEGGLVALYSAAADTRIDAVAVSGYFQSREGVWQEPIYRSVWSLLHEFGDAQIAGLIAPRTMVVEAARHPEVAGPPAARKGRADVAAPGRLTTPPLESVRGEFERAKPIFTRLGAGTKLSLTVSGDGRGDPGAAAALKAFAQGLGFTGPLRHSSKPPADRRAPFDQAERMRRQVHQLEVHSQRLIRNGAVARQRFWSKADASSVEKWNESIAFYRKYLWEEVIGKLPPASLPMSAATRQLYDRPEFKGYEVMLPVWPDVFAYGILLVPKDLKPGERRPVVVAQHGVDSYARDVIESRNRSAENYYHEFGAKLAKQGFVVYAPQNPYFGEPFRLLLRKAHPLKLSLFSFILGQHERTLEWLASLPFVDARRIGFYGLSYGGKTAVRVPPLLPQYALSICSADFNDWIEKIAAVDQSFSYLYSSNHGMLEFDLGNTFNYAEMANLMAPRPFMVERGHSDTVGRDEFVAYEYAKVRRFYTMMGLGDRTRIEYFNGPHTIHGVGTFEFLHKHLNWPAP